MINAEREKVWQQRVAQWRDSGQSQRSYAIEHGFAVRQFGYWVRRLAKSSQALPALMPVRVAAATAAAPAITLCSERGWRLTLPGDVPAGWLAELMRAL